MTTIITITIDEDYSEASRERIADYLTGCLHDQLIGSIIWIGRVPTFTIVVDEVTEEAPNEPPS